MLNKLAIINPMTRGLQNPKIYVTTPDQTPWVKFLRWKRIATGAFITVFTLGIFWLLFFSPVFAVSDLLISGPATDDMLARFSQFRGQNIFLLHSERLEQELKLQYPHIKNITIFRGLPNALKIEIATRKEALVWSTGGKRFFIDFEGYPFAIAQESDRTLAEALREVVAQPEIQLSADLPLVTDTRNAPVKLGTPLVSPEFVTFVQTIYADFQPTIDVALTAFKVGETTFQIEVATAENYVVFFDTTRKPTPQLTALKKILDTNRPSVKEYVDLRVIGKAYVK